MFDPWPHKADLCMQSELNLNPLDSSKLNMLANFEHWP
jgi:hypothetical protein